MPDSLLIALIVIGGLCALILLAVLACILIFAGIAVFGRKKVAKVVVAAVSPPSRKFFPSEVEYGKVLAEVETFRRRPGMLRVEALEWHDRQAVHMRQWSELAGGQVTERFWIDDGVFHRTIVRAFGLQADFLDSVSVEGPATMSEISDYHAAIHRLTGVTEVAVDGAIPRTISHRGKSIRA